MTYCFRPRTARDHASLIRQILLIIWLLQCIFTPYEWYPSFGVDPQGGFGVAGIVLGHGQLRLLVWSKLVFTSLKSAAVILILYTSWRTACGRLPHICLFITVLVLDSLMKSVGAFANHGQSTAILLLGVFAIYGDLDYVKWPCRVDAKPSDGRYAELLWWLTLIVILPYFYTGLNRLLYGQFQFLSGEPMANYLASSSKNFSRYSAWISPEWIRVVGQWGFVIVTGIELMSPTILIWRRIAAPWAVAIIAFHVATAFLMNIFFWENAILIAAICLPGRPTVVTDVDA